MAQITYDIRRQILECDDHRVSTTLLRNVAAWALRYGSDNLECRVIGPNCIAVYENRNGSFWAVTVFDCTALSSIGEHAMTTLDTIPRQVVRRVKCHLDIISTYNAEMERLEHFADALGQAGRYTAEYHLTQIERIERAQAQLAVFERQAQLKNIDPQEVYTELGGDTQARELSTATQAWLDNWNLKDEEEGT